MTQTPDRKDMARNSDEMIRHVGYDCLGPVVHRWLLALDQHVHFFDKGSTSFLYCARAGVRIRRLYDLYLDGLGRQADDRHHMFWISRLALCKGTYAHNRRYAAEIIAREYYHQPMRDLIKGLFRHDQTFLDANEDLLQDGVFDAHGFNFPGWLKSDHPLVEPVDAYLRGCSDSFDAYLSSLIGDSTDVVLIDSGWQGTSQSILHRAFPSLDWHGLYVGRILTPAHDAKIADKVIGLLFQSESYDPDRPETAITLHRHLFETLLEPNGPSIEEITGGPNDDVAQDQIQANLNERVDPERDALFLHVEAYLRDHAGLGPAAILANHQQAAPELARILARPTRDEALAVLCKDRSADFGKDLDVPVLIDPDGDTLASDLNVDQRIQRALWPQGQIALEYTGAFRESLQNRVSGQEDNTSHFDPMGTDAATQTAGINADLPKGPLVAIVTRTKNRPILLRRAADSVARQTYDSYVWVVVNDGGDEDVVREVIAQSAVDRRKIHLVSNARSLGMEAASNVGIRSVDSDYIIIHDDDDALHPQFLEKTVRFLEGSGGKRYDGVVTGSEYISEEIRGDKVIEHARRPYMNWVRNIHLSELLAQNLFAPISFLYRRCVYDDIGGYNEELPVLGDWYFNLEFVLRSDIKVMQEPLAYYYHRDFGDSSRQGIYANSVVGGQSKHEEFASVFRNMFMRQYGNSSPLAAAAISAYFATDIRNRLDAVGKRIGQLEHAVGTGAAPQETQNRTDTAEIDRLWLLVHIQRADMNRKGRKNQDHDAADLDAPIDALVQIMASGDIPVAIQPQFDEEAYLTGNPDVKAAVDSRNIPSGYVHYLMNGRKEGRERPYRKTP